MTLTSGRGPLTPHPAGRFTPPLPAAGRHVYVEPYRRRVHATVGGRTVVDSERVALVHRPGHAPAYAFPAGDVDGVEAVATSELDGYVEVPWSAADAWYEEGTQVFLHARNPFHRVDCLTATRRLVVEVGGVTVVDTDDTVVLYETSLDPKLYVDRALLRVGVDLVRSETTTYCPYKGTTTYWTLVVGDRAVEDAAWSYDDPLPESEAIRGLLSFEPSRVTVTTDVPPPAF